MARTFFSYYVDAVATLGDLYRNSFLIVKRGKKSGYELLKVTSGGKLVRTRLMADAAPEGVKTLDAKTVKDGIGYDAKKGAYFIQPAVEAALVRVRPEGFSRDEGKPLTQNLGDLMRKAGF